MCSINMHGSLKRVWIVFVVVFWRVVCAALVREVRRELWEGKII